MNRIELTDTIESAIIKLGEGNPGAITVLAHIVQGGAQIDPDDAFGGFGTLMSLDMDEIYGSRIWMLFKDVCGQDLPSAIAMCRAVQLGLLPISELNHAIDNMGAGLDVAGTCKLVKERLPRFQFNIGSAEVKEVT